MRVQISVHWYLSSRSDPTRKMAVPNYHTSHHLGWKQDFKPLHWKHSTYGWDFNPHSKYAHATKWAKNWQIDSLFRPCKPSLEMSEMWLDQVSIYCIIVAQEKMRLLVTTAKEAATNGCYHTLHCIHAQAASSKEQGQWRQTLGGCDSHHAAGVKDYWP